MLRFMYTFDYDGSGNDHERISPMLFNVEVYSTAEKYDILALELRAKKKFDKSVRTCCDMDDFAHCITVSPRRLYPRSLNFCSPIRLRSLHTT